MTSLEGSIWVGFRVVGVEAGAASRPGNKAGG